MAMFNLFCCFSDKYITWGLFTQFVTEAEPLLFLCEIKSSHDKMTHFGFVYTQKGRGRGYGGEKSSIIDTLKT